MHDVIISYLTRKLDQPMFNEFDFDEEDKADFPGLESLNGMRICGSMYPDRHSDIRYSARAIQSHDQRGGSYGLANARTLKGGCLDRYLSAITPELDGSVPAEYIRATLTQATLVLALVDFEKPEIDLPDGVIALNLSSFSQKRGKLSFTIELSFVHVQPHARGMGLGQLLSGGAGMAIGREIERYLASNYRTIELLDLDIIHESETKQGEQCAEALYRGMWFLSSVDIIESEIEMAHDIITDATTPVPRVNFTVINEH